MLARPGAVQCPTCGADIAPAPEWDPYEDPAMRRGRHNAALYARLAFEAIQSLWDCSPDDAKPGEDEQIEAVRVAIEDYVTRAEHAADRRADVRVVVENSSKYVGRLFRAMSRRVDRLQDDLDVALDEVERRGTDVKDR